MRISDWSSDVCSSDLLPKGKLKTLALKDGYKDNQKLGFKRTHFPWLYEIPAQFQGKIKPPHVVLDLYPRVEALYSKDKGTAPTTEARNKGKLNQTLFRSEEHTSDLQSLMRISYAVFCLKKKKKNTTLTIHT